MTATRSVPGPRGLPVLGNLLDVDRNLVRTFERAWHEHGDVFRLRFGPDRVVVVVAPEDVAQVLHNREGFISRSAYHRFARLFGNGLLTAEGERWRRSRRTLQPLFARRRLERLIPDFTASTDELLARWSGLSSVPDITGEMSWVTLRAVTRTLFDWDLSPKLDALCGHMNEIARAANIRIFAPGLLLRLPTAANRRFEEAIAHIDDAIYERIATARAARKQGATLLAALLDARDPETGRGLSDEQIRDELITMFVAGHETTSLLLTWTFSRLSEHPHWLNAVRDEVDRVLGDRQPTADALRSMTVSSQVLQEALRLHPPAWGIPREAAQTHVLPSGFEVEAGSMVILCPWLTHRHPEHWDNPEGFDPSRFGPDAPRRNPYAFYPFGRAQRMCIGSDMALLEALVVLVRVLQHATLTLERRTAPCALGTLRPDGTLAMRVEWRR